MGRPVSAVQALRGQSIYDDEPDEIYYQHAQTPTQRVPGPYFLKRDDLYSRPGIPVYGAKVRAAAAIVAAAKTEGKTMVVFSSDRNSATPLVVALVAKEAGLQVELHVPAGKRELAPEIVQAVALGISIYQHRPGYMSVIAARARASAQDQNAYLIPMGLESKLALWGVAGQVPLEDDMPQDWSGRIVVPTGSGMTLAGILHGLALRNNAARVLAVCVGQDPRKRIAKYAPPGWEQYVDFVNASIPFHSQPKELMFHDVMLDPHYEAKCVEHLQPGDLLWIVALRDSLRDWELF